MSGREPIEPFDVIPALELADHEMVSIVGGGGKTTTLFLLGQQRSGRTILTTTTKMGRDRTSSFPPLVAPSDEELERALDRHGTVLVWSEAADHKALGVSPGQCDRWFDLVDTIGVEADGSRQLPFKAPLHYEPVIPSRSTTVLACIGSDALGTGIIESCQRPERVAEIAQCSVHDVLTPARAAAVLLGADGSRRGVPTGAAFVVLITRVTDATRDAGEELLGLLEGHARAFAIRNRILENL